MSEWLDQNVVATVAFGILSLLICIAGGILKYLMNINRVLGNIQGALKPMIQNVMALQYGHHNLTKRVGRLEGQADYRTRNYENSDSPHLVPFPAADATVDDTVDDPNPENDEGNPDDSQTFPPGFHSGYDGY